MAVNLMRFAFRPDDRLGAVFEMAARQVFQNGLTVFPPFEFLRHINRPEFPLFQRVGFANKEAVQLLGAPNIKPKFEQVNTAISVSRFQWKDLSKEPLAHIWGTNDENADTHAFVVGFHSVNRG